MDAFECPRCGGNGYKLLSLSTGSALHWMWLLNPLFLFSELLLGMRLPAAMYRCVKCDQPLALRQYVKCEHCNTLHSLLLWEMGNSVGHWFGFFCPDCGARIPMATNLMCLLILVVLTPVRLIVWPLIRKDWIEMERHRALRRRDPRFTDRVPFQKPMKVGLTVGLVSWIACCIFEGFFHPLNADFFSYCVIILPVSLGAGALFGVVAKAAFARRQKFKAGHCRVCGYDLHGLPSDRCPECGFQFDTADRPGDPAG
jgi:hypothetical protein